MGKFYNLVVLRNMLRTELSFSQTEVKSKRVQKYGELQIVRANYSQPIILKDKLGNALN